jgi:hypothetical protein
MIHRRLAPCLVGAAILLGACSGDDDASSVTVPDDEVTTSTSTTTASTSTSDPDADVKKAIEQAYYAQFEAFVTILSRLDPSDPLIDEHYAGRQKEQTLDAIAKNLADGTALRAPDDPSRLQAAVLSVDVADDGTTARLVACVVDGILVVRRNSGEVVNDAIVTLRIQHDFVLDSGHWKVTETERLERKEGIHECAE